MRKKLQNIKSSPSKWTKEKAPKLSRILNYGWSSNSNTLPTTVQEDRGGTTPLLGRTQYFLGFVVLTYYQHKSKGRQDRTTQENK